MLRRVIVTVGGAALLVLAGALPAFADPWGGVDCGQSPTPACELGAGKGGGGAGHADRAPVRGRKVLVVVTSAAEPTEATTSWVAPIRCTAPTSAATTSQLLPGWRPSRTGRRLGTGWSGWRRRVQAGVGGPGGDGRRDR